MPGDPQPDVIPAERVYADDFVIEHGGKPYYTHRGEWVEVIRGLASEAELITIIDASRLSMELAAIKSDMDAAKERNDDQAFATALLARSDLIRQNFDDVAIVLADHITDWNFTGRNRKPLPKPDGTIGPIQRLTPEEVGWLRDVISSEGPAERKNGSND